MGKLSFSEIFSFNNLPQEAKEKHADKEIIYHGMFACSLEIVMIQLKFNKKILETNYFCRSEVTYDASKYFIFIIIINYFVLIGRTRIDTVLSF